MLLKEFLEPMGITEKELANQIHLSYEAINELINGTIDVSPSIALRLGKFFGVSADFWLNLQLRWDLYHTQQAEANILSTIKQYVTT
jgi:addiction module HigA family antidote